MKKRILVVEDDENIRDVLELLLARAGFTVFTSATGKDIFNTIQNISPDLILLDVLLGELDGRDICKALKTHMETAHIPVIIVSGVYNIFSTIVEAKANDVISKPFTEEILLRRVQRQLSKKN